MKTEPRRIFSVVALLVGYGLGHCLHDRLTTSASPLDGAAPGEITVVRPAEGMLTVHTLSSPARIDGDQYKDYQWEPGTWIVKIPSGETFAARERR